jgi:hypothetical protein
MALGVLRQQDVGLIGAGIVASIGYGLLTSYMDPVFLHNLAAL